jgi:maltose/moltooligosaccharide transporter
MGVYMGIFNFFIVLPEILAALTFGPLVKHVLGGNLVHAVMAGGVFMLLAAVLAQWVKSEEAETSNIEHRTSKTNLWASSDRL